MEAEKKQDAQKTLLVQFQADADCVEKERLSMEEAIKSGKL